MNTFKLPEYRKEFISNFISNKITIPAGKQDVGFSTTLINLNYENGAIYYFSIYIYEESAYNSYTSGLIDEFEARKGGISQKVNLVALLFGNKLYSFPDYIDFPIEMSVKQLNYEVGKIYAAVFKLENKNGEEISRAVTYLKGVENE